MNAIKMTQGSAFREFSRMDLLIAAVLLVVALLLRLPFQASSPFSVDEFYTASHAADRAFRLMNPLYYLLALGSSELFGSEEWVYRLPALVLGFVTPAALYLIFIPVLGRKAAALAGLLIAVNAWHLMHSLNARFYTGVFLFGGLAAGFYFVSILRGRVIWLVFHLVTVVLASAFHATALLVAASCGAASMLLAVNPRILSPKSGSVLVGRIHVAVGALAALVTIPFIFRLLGDWSGSGQNWGRTSLGLALQLANRVEPAVLIAAFFGWLFLLQRSRITAVITAFVIALPIALLALIADIAAVRADYLFSIAPVIFMLAAFCCTESLRSEMSSPLIAVSFAAILLGTSIPSTISHYTYHATYDTLDPITEVRNRLTENDEVIAMVEGFDYYGINAPLRTYPASPFDRQAPWSGILASGSDRYQRTWVVVPVRRTDIALPLRELLWCSGSLRWRKIAKRFDYSEYGSEVYEINWEDPQARACFY